MLPERIFTTELERRYNESILTRLTRWKEESGNSLRKLAAAIGVSYTSIGDYLNQKYKANVRVLENKITTFLDNKEGNLQRSKNPEFCRISPSEIIWQVLQACDENGEMGAVIGPSGMAKTKTGREYQRKNPVTIFITASPTVRSFSKMLRALANQVSAPNSNMALDDIMYRVIEKLKGFRPLIVIDESQYMLWESFEIVRNIYDSVGMGVVFLGTVRLYSRMKGDTRYDWDQLLSRVTFRRSISEINYEDIKMVADSIYPGLPKRCIDFLYHVAQEPGRLRVMTDLLKKAIKFHEVYGAKLDINLFKELKNMNDF